MKLALAVVMMSSIVVAQPPAGESAKGAPPLVDSRTLGVAQAATQEIFFAVLEGLYRDGVDNEVVDRILERDSKTGYPVNFVYSCPICQPAYDAMALYRGRPRFHGLKGDPDTFGPGLPEAVRREILSAELVPRQQAIQVLCERWIKSRLDGLAWSDEQRARFRMEMEIGRKNGMARLSQFAEQGGPSSYRAMKTCPFCEAANGACGR